MKKLILLLVSFVVCIGLLEVLLRVHFHIQDPIVQARKTSVESGFKLGWDLRPDHEYKISDSGFYKVNDEGFRFAPELHDDKKKTILLIGDSFTHAPELANEDVYYAKLGKLDINFYSYGVVGWGNIQQVLKVESIIEKVNPDILIWQFSANDLIENSFAIESRLGKKSFGRPYLGNDSQIVYDRDLDFVSKFRSYFKDSRAVGYLFNKLHVISSLNSEEIQFSGEEIQTSKVVLQHVMKKMKGLLKRETLIFSFNAGPLPFDNSLFFEAANREGHIYIYEIESMLKKAKKEKEEIFLADQFHWTKEGHQKVSLILTQKIKRALQDQNNQ